MAIILFVVSLLLWFYLPIRNGKANVLLAVGSFFFFPLMFVALGLYWKDEEHDIKIPFFIFLAVGGFTGYLFERDEQRQKVIEGLLWGLQLAA